MGLPALLVLLFNRRQYLGHFHNVGLGLRLRVRNVAVENIKTFLEYVGGRLGGPTGVGGVEPRAGG